MRMTTHGRVLLLERDAVLRELLELLLRDEGFEVEPCASLADVWGRARGWPDEVVLVDAWQPGLRAAERRGLADLATTLPLVLVADESLATTHLARAIGAAVVLPKPFDLEALLAAIRDVQDQFVRGRQQWVA